MIFPDKYDPIALGERVVALDNAKALLAKKPDRLPIWAVGCLLGNQDADISEIKSNIEELLKTTRVSRFLLSCNGNPVRRVENKNEQIECRAGGFKVPGVHEKKEFTGAEATLSRGDVKRLLDEFLGCWPLSNDCLLRPWFGDSVIGDSEVPQKTQGDNLSRRCMSTFVPIQGRVTPQGQLVRAVIKNLASAEMAPTHREAFADVLGNLEKYSEHVESVNSQHQTMVLKDGGSEMNLKSFRQAYTNCFKK